jgi:predicted DNA-binding transcriptional regulator AlpA
MLINRGRQMLIGAWRTGSNNHRLANMMEKSMGIQTLKRKPVTEVTASSGHQAAIEPLMTFQQVADMARLPLNSFYNLRSRGMGPKAICLGRRTIRFRRSDVEEWLRANESVVPA